MVKGAWSRDETYQARQTVSEMLNTVNHLVDSIYDISAVHSLPQDLLPHVQRTTSQARPNTGAIVVVSTNRLLTLLYRAFQRIAKTSNRHIEIYLVPTVEAAHELIADIRAQRAQSR